jgi:uncharacterized protein (TIGR02284 family)
MDRNDTIGILNNLIETCRDGQEGFQEASENIVRPDIKQLFMEAALQRARYLGQLQAEVRALGGDPADTGSVGGALHRAWIDIKGTFSGKDEASILAEAERGEDSAVAAYRDALENELPANLRAIVAAQYAEVQRTHDLVKQYRNSYERLPDAV